ncbi:MAG: DUF3365 domain-containing protein [Candidatus Brocadiaceae bacterium]|nr:DUF3365 domain-containing protein [Candidatus Brocadiaceae bacterium]
MPLSKRFALVLVVLFIIVAIGICFTYGITKTLEKDKKVINIAGRQRMLIQKYAREKMRDLLPSQIRHTTLKAARIATIQIVEDRKYFTKYTIEKLKKDCVVEVHPNKDYAKIDGGIPLPATFVQEVSNKINELGVYSYNLLSKWNINRKKGLNTDFEKDAFDYLSVNKESEFISFVIHNGLYSLRYATSDIASSSSCVSCHNNHEDSQKKDFKLGDVMGILVVNIPIGTISTEAGIILVSPTDKDFNKDTFTKTKKMFDITHKALVRGGKAPLDMEMREFIILPPANDPVIKSKLEEAQKFWYLVQDNLRTLLITTPNSSEYLVAYKTSYDNINNTMTVMNEAVNMYQFKSDRKAALLLWCVIGGCLVATLIIIRVCWTLANKHILLPIDKLSSGTMLITEGKLDNDVDVKSRDEIGMLAQNFNDMIHSMRKSKFQIETSNWLKTGQAELYEIMQIKDDLPRLSRDIITYIAEYLNAEVGIIYMTKKWCSVLKIVGSYAFSNPHHRSDTFKFGEGLVGQAALEKRTILTTDIPKDYIEIDTGWGKAVPRNILIVPLLNMGTVKGAIELGSHNKFTNIQLEFLDTVARSIAMAFSSSQNFLKDEVFEHIEPN